MISKYGDASVVSIVRDAAKPVAENGKVLIEIHAASLNPVDSMIRMGYMDKFAPLHFPAILGTDAAGVVTGIGAGTNAFKTGDKVFGSASVLAGGSGAFAEYASVPAGRIAKMPGNVTFEQAASLPLTGVSAFQAIYEYLKLDKGATILIQGGSGGIGSIAIQMAKTLGARVIATCRRSAADYVKSLGADEVIDFEKAGLQGIRDCDAILDTAGGEAYKSLFACLKKGGTILTIAAQTDAELAAKYGVTSLGMMTDVTASRLESLARLVTEGKVKPFVDRIFPMDKVSDAFTAREAGRVKGKIVLQVLKG